MKDIFLASIAVFYVATAMAQEPLIASIADTIDLPTAQVIQADLDLATESVFVVNMDTQDIIVSKNENEVRSIASITKMMTAYVVLQQQVDLDEQVRISEDDIRLAKRANRPSKLRAGMMFTRERLLNLALMYSENVAAAALGRTTFSGGTEQFVGVMNSTAASLHMTSTKYVDPIGIGVENTSTASDLVRLIAMASTEDIIRDFSTTKFQPIQLPSKHAGKPTMYNNTNALVGFKDWNILLQKTGFTNAAGHCVVMVIDLQGQQYIVVELGAPDNQQRAYDAIKIRGWLESGAQLTTSEAQPLSPYKFKFYKHGVPVVVHHKRHRKHNST